MEKNYNVIGIMSGTSLDGIDLAHVFLKKTAEKWTYEIVESETVPYSTEWITRLKSAIGFSPEQLHILNVDYTWLLAEVINDFIERHNLDAIDAVCSHGHTILHQPQNEVTLQIGNLPLLSGLVQQNIVCDFRVQDVELGGQGAPLVPIGDQLLFPEYDYCLNLGGFSNVSFEYQSQRIAFDISPVNTVLNFYANSMGLDYDDKGKLAQSGNCNEAMLNALNALPFYRMPFPKSLGFEFVRDAVLPLMEEFEIPAADKLHTFITHVAFQTAAALPKKEGKMLVSGGGVYNEYLIFKIREYLPDMDIRIPDAKTIEYKEALIFALLGVLKLRGEINVLASVTGAQNNHSSGQIYYI